MFVFQPDLMNTVFPEVGISKLGLPSLQSSWEQCNVRILGLQPSEDSGYAVCKGYGLELSTTNRDGLDNKRCPAVLLTVPTPNKALPTLLSRAAMHFGIWCTMKNLFSAAFLGSLQIGTANVM